MKDVHS
jgi:hypothetical protein